MDQLRGAHDNGRAANAPAQTRNLTEHRAARINYAQNTIEAVGGQGPEERRVGGIPDHARQVQRSGPRAPLPPQPGRRQGRKQLEKGADEGDKEEHPRPLWLALPKRSQLALFFRSVPGGYFLSRRYSPPLWPTLHSGNSTTISATGGSLSLLCLFASLVVLRSNVG
jgi:hypothetical protein